GRLAKRSMRRSTARSTSPSPPRASTGSTGSPHAARSRASCRPGGSCWSRGGTRCGRPGRRRSPRCPPAACSPSKAGGRSGRSRSRRRSTSTSSRSTRATASRGIACRPGRPTRSTPPSARSSRRTRSRASSSSSKRASPGDACRTRIRDAKEAMPMTRETMALLAGLLMCGSASTADAQISTKEQQAEQDALDAKTPKLNAREEVLQLLVPGFTMGQTVGVDVNSQNHIFVYSRTNPQGIARGGIAAMLWEFDAGGAFVKEWGPHNYAASFAHSVRVDAHDNVWQVDEGSGMVVKYSPGAVPLEQFGRTPEAIDYLEEMIEKMGRGFERGARELEHPADLQHRLHPDGGVGTFNRPTDV